MPDTSRDPSPYVMVDDVGASFSFRVMGGVPIYTIIGLKEAPKGTRISSTASYVMRKVPSFAAKCSIWSCLGTAISCSMEAIRKREDGWNPVVGGALSALLLEAKKGPIKAAGAAVLGGALMAGIEISSIIDSRSPRDNISDSEYPDLDKF